MSKHKDLFYVSFGDLKMDCKPEECPMCIFRNKCSKRMYIISSQEPITSVAEGIEELTKGEENDK